MKNQPQTSRRSVPPGQALFTLLGLAALLLLWARPPGSAAAQTATGNQVVVNYVEGAQLPGELAYEVRAYLSALDSNRNPIPGLALTNFSASEDSLPVELSQVEVVESPISLILVMDTSQSMSAQGKIEAVQAAAIAFVNRLQAEDAAALVSFDVSVVRQAELTTDHALVGDRIRLLAATGAGTCLYDAAYDAVTMASAAPGRRAVVLLTDGRDEKVLADNSAVPCSQKVLDDVIDYAAGTAHVPVYALGVGQDVDAQGLSRVASLTGGLHAQVSAAADVDAYFNLLTAQLSAQYELVYRSVAAPGAHQLVVTLDYGGSRASGTYSFVLPQLAAVPRIVAPQDGAEVSGSVQVVASVQGSGDVSRLALLVNGTEVASDATTPFEFRWDASGLAGQSAALEVVIYDSAGAEVARSTAVTVIVLAPTAPPTVAPTSMPTAAPTATPGGVTLTGSTLAMVIIVSGVVLAGVLAFFALRWQQRRKSAGYVTWSAAPDEPFAALVVEQSDSVSAGRRYDLRKPVTTLGRSSECDIVLPDRPISRRHAELREQDGVLTVVEIKSEQDGKLAAPRYGTFVNDTPVPPAGKPLKHGDRVRLGNRTVLRLERPEARPADVTLDILAAPDRDRTFDALAIPVEQKDIDATREIPDETRELPGAKEPPPVQPDATRELPPTTPAQGADETRVPEPPAKPPDQTRQIDDDQPPPSDATREIQ